MNRFADKDPTDIVDYGLDLSDLIWAGDALDTASWDASDPGITVSDLAPAGNIARVRVSGGTAGETYVLTCTATLDSGQQVERNLMIRVRKQ